MELSPCPSPSGMYAKTVINPFLARKILSNIISACVGLCVVTTFSEDEAKAGCPTLWSLDDVSCAT